MKFTKMQGIGNDYIYVNCFEENVPDPAKAARILSDRHFGVGSDGLILIKPSQEADFEMEMYNLDGSRGAMCGNGIRCVAKYVYDYGLTDKTTITVSTPSGVKTLELTIKDGKAALVRVNMGKPILTPEDIPVALPGEPHNAASPGRVPGKAVKVPITAGNMQTYFTAVSMGNPHAVIFMPEVTSLDLASIGPNFEHHPYFPDRVNTEFIRVIDRHTLQMRVWERGSGETLACGTGACASVVAAILNGLVDADAPVTVHLLGGDLEIFWDQTDGAVFMTGPARVVFEGDVELADLMQE